MLISREEALRLLVYDNPWWAAQVPDPTPAQHSFAACLLADGLARADARPLLLAGPYHSGKTSILLHAVRTRLLAGDPPETILYIPAGDALFASYGPAALLDLCVKGHGLGADVPMTVLVDDAERLENWEETVLQLARIRPGLRVAVAASVVPGRRCGFSAAGSRGEQFRPVPVGHPSFAQWLRTRGLEESLVACGGDEGADVLCAPDMVALNREFLAYANHGAPLSLNGCRGGAGCGLRNRLQLREALGAVFSTDLPGLYGITDVRLLTRLFGAVAWRTGELTTFAGLARECGCSPGTARRYFEYLEDAFLVCRITRVNEQGRDVRGAPFKCYVAAPWMRAALYLPVEEDGEAVKRVAETALFAQWHAAGYGASLRYARNMDGGVDLVGISASTGQPSWACSVSYEPAAEPSGLEGLAVFAREAGVDGAVSAATFDAMGATQVKGVAVSAVPCALLSYAIGRNTEAV